MSMYKIKKLKLNFIRYYLTTSIIIRLKIIIAINPPSILKKCLVNINYFSSDAEIGKTDDLPDMILKRFSIKSPPA